MSLSRFEQSLFESGSRDAPSPDRRAAARAAVLRAGAVSAAVAGTTTSTTPASAAVGGATAPAATAATTLKAVTLGRLLFVAVIGVGGATLRVAASRTESTTPSAPIAPSVRASTARPVEPPTATAVPMAATETTPPPSPDGPPPTAIRHAPRGAAASARVERHASVDDDPLAVEARLLESARRCLAVGDRVCARSRIAEHHRRFERAALASEATVLAFDLALAEGDRRAAQRLARAALEGEPDGSWPSRLRKLAGSADE
jgi:hypothetical protein